MYDKGTDKTKDYFNIKCEELFSANAEDPESMWVKYCELYNEAVDKFVSACLYRLNDGLTRSKYLKDINSLEKKHRLWQRYLVTSNKNKSNSMAGAIQREAKSAGRAYCSFELFKSKSLFKKSGT